ncbi:MAG: lipoprotein [Enterobacteriaceae bacterium]|jgi:predicted small lipoprotein YifL|nr:lipoprotein [Enterobacteriaceae bacterium]
MMNKQFRWSLAIVTLLSIAGCGLKGPLYFPPEKPIEPQNSVNQAQPANAVSQGEISQDNGSQNETSAGAQ